ncbi:MAG: 2-C-methyl-D-erythritol 2,4-cyclodiphosphate synthase [Oscillospiraceae bacterium]|jgi:2-C-methyl-D-erythritol 2,4-cyclodiphosphate synthase|nr:2-C-methyl-D-erythritol 2,4-cyclodiphosphate synthase [Oscillospiraceae bacterium]
MKIRIGHGYDAHRFAEGRRLILCGTEIPYERGLLGHSDADAAAHALIDALLGALALGDIGAHFPPGDPRYEGADSMALLRAVYGLVTARGYTLSNADITIIAQEPRLSGYVGQMRRNVADALDTEVGNVSVKATTEEKMGFTGHGEGIAAHAAVLLERVSG